LLRASERVGLGLLPLLLIPGVFIVTRPLHYFGTDFNTVYWPDARRLVAGLSPYDLPRWHALHYLPPAAFAFAPLTVLPQGTAAALFTTITILSIPAALWLVGVRDWRIYGIVFLWQPVIIGYETANAELPLVAAVAALWRFRDRPAVAGALLAALVSVKPVLFPFGVWMLATRRVRALAWGLGIFAVANTLGWAIIGFDQLGVFTSELSRFGHTFERESYSLIGLAVGAGAGQLLADAAGALAAGGLIAIGLRSRGPDRERIVFSACAGATIFVSPVVEAHYAAVLIVPLGLAVPRLRPVWALPMLLALTPAVSPSSWQHILAFAVTVAVVGVSMRARSRGESHVDSIGEPRLVSDGRRWRRYGRAPAQ